MGEKNNQLTTSHYWLGLSNLVLAGIFTWNLTRLFKIHETVQKSLEYPLLSGDNAEFVARIQRTDVQWWVWLATSIAIITSLALLLGMFIPALTTYRQTISKASYAWLAIWIIYVVVIIAIGSSLVNSILNT